MIDYSVFMMGNPMDVDAAQKAYAKAQVSEIMPFSQPRVFFLQARIGECIHGIGAVEHLGCDVPGT